MSKLGIEIGIEERRIKIESIKKIITPQRPRFKVNMQTKGRSKAIGITNNLLRVIH